MRNHSELGFPLSQSSSSRRSLPTSCSSVSLSGDALSACSRPGSSLPEATGRDSWYQIQAPTQHIVLMVDRHYRFAAILVEFDVLLCLSRSSLFFASGFSSFPLDPIQSGRRHGDFDLLR